MSSHLDAKEQDAHMSEFPLDSPLWTCGLGLIIYSTPFLSQKVLSLDDKSCGHLAYEAFVPILAIFSFIK